MKPHRMNRAEFIGTFERLLKEEGELWAVPRKTTSTLNQAKRIPYKITNAWSFVNTEDGCSLKFNEGPLYIKYSNNSFFDNYWHAWAYWEWIKGRLK